MTFLSFLFHKEPSLWEKWERTLHSLLPYAVTLYWCIFFTLLIFATVGRKLKLRRFYIRVLDGLFFVAAVKMEEQEYREKIKRKQSFMEDDDEDEEEDLSMRKNRTNSVIKDTVEKQLHCQDCSNNFLHRKNTPSGQMSPDFCISSQQGSGNQQDLSDSSLSSWEEMNVENYVNQSYLCNNLDKIQNTYYLKDAKQICFAPANITSLGSENDLVASDMKLRPNSSACNSPLNIKICKCSQTSPNICQANCSAETPPQACPSCSSPDPVADRQQDLVKFPLDSPMLFIAAGVRAILDDCVSSSFSPAQLKTWNLLSRTILRKERLRHSKGLAVFYVCGLLVRYVFLMPMRVLVLGLSLANFTFSTFMVGCLPNGGFKRTVNSYVMSWGFDFVAGSLSMVARFHNKENRPDHGIAVANHTSPIDGMVLATDNCYDMVGQRTKGLLGMFMSALAKSSGHIWFERSDARDRQATTRLLTEHTRRQELPPILIFPEGVCVNNTAVLEFRKGAFEVDCDIFPVALRFDPLYGDAFWYEGGFSTYCFSMMTSWAIVCDVFYLPPMRRAKGESASLFASRVRSCIAQKVGLVELEWSSVVKSSVFNTEKWDQLKTEKQMEKQREFASTLRGFELTAEDL